MRRELCDGMPLNIGDRVRLTAELHLGFLVVVGAYLDGEGLFVLLRQWDGKAPVGPKISRPVDDLEVLP